MGKTTKDSGKITIKPRREFSSGGVVFKDNLWLVTKAMPSKLFPKTPWRLPKGWIDNEKENVPGPMARGDIKADEKSLQKAALREVGEEAGIKAKIIKKIGTSRYIYKNPTNGLTFKFVTFYLMEYEKDLPQGFGDETSEIMWLPYNEAYKKLSFFGEKQILKKAKHLV